MSMIPRRYALPSLSALIYRPMRLFDSVTSTSTSTSTYSLNTASSAAATSFIHVSRPPQVDDPTSCGPSPSSPSSSPSSPRMQSHAHPLPIDMRGGTALRFLPLRHSRPFALTPLLMNSYPLLTTRAPLGLAHGGAAAGVQGGTFFSLATDPPPSKTYTQRRLVG